MSAPNYGVWVDAIPGGYRRISTDQLCRIWTLHLEGHLKRLDLRVWFALHEMEERRCTLERGRRPKFRIEEVGSLLGDTTEQAARASIRRLNRLGICAARTHGIRFGHSRKAECPREAAMRAVMPFRKRWLHVPRRVLRSLATGRSRAETAVLLGAVARCVFFHRAESRHRVDGRLPARWVADAFGVCERAVVAARKRVVALGWLTPLESPGWSVARFGKRVMLAVGRVGSAPGWVRKQAGSACAWQTRHLLRRIYQQLARRAKGAGREGGGLVDRATRLGEGPAPGIGAGPALFGGRASPERGRIPGCPRPQSRFYGGSGRPQAGWVGQPMMELTNNTTLSRVSTWRRRSDNCCVNGDGRRVSASDGWRRRWAWTFRT